MDDADKPKRKAKGRNRGYGQGSIYPSPNGRGHIVQVYDGQGHLIRRRAATPEAAEALRKELIRQRDGGVDLQAGEQTIQSYLNMWYRDVALQRGIRAKTALHYRSVIERYILPRLGERRLSSLKAADVQSWLNWLREHGLSDQSVRHAFSVFRDALTTAERWRLIDRNPCALVDTPKVRRKEITPLTIEETRGLLKVVAGHRLELLYHLALVLGLREGELLGLQWRDVDTTLGTLSIARQAQSLPGQGTQLVAPKSTSSVRTLPLPPQLWSRFAASILAERKATLKAGGVWRDDALVFATSTSTATQARNAVRHFKAACVAAQIRVRDTGKRTKRGKPIFTSDAHFHLMRHTAASALVEAGTPEAVIAAILGHAGGTVTRRYSHASLAAMREAVEKVEQLLLQEAA